MSGFSCQNSQRSICFASGEEIRATVVALIETINCQITIPLTLLFQDAHKPTFDYCFPGHIILHAFMCSQEYCWNNAHRLPLPDVHKELNPNGLTTQDRTRK